MKTQNYDKESDYTPGMIRASEIVKWVFKHSDSYPLPKGYNGGEIFYDCPLSIQFKVSCWSNISKTDFARLWSVAPPQVSRWIKAGLPVRPDDRLDYHTANEWVESYKEANEEKQAIGWRHFEGNADQE